MRILRRGFLKLVSGLLPMPLLNIQPMEFLVKDSAERIELHLYGGGFGVLPEDVYCRGTLRDGAGNVIAQVISVDIKLGGTVSD